MITTILIPLSIFSFTLISCDKKMDDPTPVNPSALDSSYVTISSEHGILFSSHFHPCELLGSSGTWINHPDTSLYEPTVTFASTADFGFKIYFKSSTLPVDKDPTLHDLYWLLEQALVSGFNKPPHVGDIIFSVKHNGKRYSNSWDPEAAGLASPPYIRDRTGLHIDVINYEIVENDCRTASFPAIHLVTDVAGFLVTSNMADSLFIEGQMDFLMATSVF